MRKEVKKDLLDTGVEVTVLFSRLGIIFILLIGKFGRKFGFDILA